tara:strand:+ start:50933 stop:51607 length:675 start_codon:yes stop_codon:yes gene_type:complete
MLIEKIDKFYEKQPYNKERTAFYVSEADTCPRQIYYSFKNKPKAQLEARTRRIFEQGDYSHMRLMSALFSMGIVKAVEITIPLNEQFNGRADAIITLEEESYVLEIKTTKDYAFKILEKPTPAMEKQLQLYLHFFNIQKGILIVENKDTQELKEFVVEKNEELINKLLQQFDYLRDQIGSTVTPQKPENLEPWKCKLCPYQFCKYFTGEKKEEFKNLDEEGNKK